MHTEVEWEGGELVPEPVGLGAAVERERCRNARIAVHATCPVERRMRVAGEHEEAHRPRLRDLGCKGSA
jgi:hypothetical protein